MMRSSSTIIQSGTRKYSQIIAAKSKSSASKFKQSAAKIPNVTHKAQPIPVSSPIKPFANKTIVKQEIEKDARNKKNFVNPHGIPIKGSITGMLGLLALLSFFDDDDF